MSFLSMFVVVLVPFVLCPFPNRPSPVVVFLRSSVFSMLCPLFPLYLPSHSHSPFPSSTSFHPSQSVPFFVSPLSALVPPLSFQPLPSLSISLCLSVAISPLALPRSRLLAYCALLSLSIPFFNLFIKFTFCIHSHTYTYTHTYPSPFYKLL